MGVTGLWRLIEPAGKPVPVETLENKVLAVDISIWLHQIVKGYQDAKGAPLPNAHLMGLFQRLCKLLYFRIKPVFVFDGGFPDLKRETIAKRQDSKLKYNSESERLKRELALILGKKTAVSSLLGNHISPKKINPAVDNTDDIFKLPALPENEIESESESEDETSSGSIVDLHSVDLESQNFKKLPAKEKYDLLIELKETRKMNSWGRLHELPKKSDNFSNFQMQRLLKRRKVQECLQETEKEMGDGGMSLNELESLLNEEGIDTKIETLPTRRIASNETTRFLLINNVKQALAEAKKKKEAEVNKNISEVKQVSKATEKDITNDKNEAEDLEKAIKMSLECVNEESDLNTSISKTDSSWTSFITDSNSEYSDSEGDGYEQPAMTSAKAYIMQYSDYTTKVINKLVNSKKCTDKNKSKVPSVDQIIDELNNEKTIIADNIELSSSDDECKKIKPGTIEISDSQKQSVVDISNEINSSSKDLEMSCNDHECKSIKSGPAETSDSLRESMVAISKENNSLCKDVEITQSSVIWLENPAVETINLDTSTEEVSIFNEDTENETVVSKLGKQKSGSNTSESDDEDLEEVPEDFNEGEKEVIELTLKIGDAPEDDIFADIFEDSKSSGASKINIKAVTNITKNQENHPIPSTSFDSIETFICPSKQVEEKHNITANSSIKVSSGKIHPGNMSHLVNLTDNLTYNAPINSQSYLSGKKNIGVIDSKIQKELTSVESVEEPSDKAEISDNKYKETVQKKTKEPISTEMLNVIAEELQNEEQNLQQEKGRLDRVGRNITEQMTKEAQELLQIFGIPYIVAPMEAEAQCAFLESVNLTDGTITDDSDIWLFGGRTVYKNFFNQKKHVLQFLSERIERSFNLSREQLILLALLVGSDYTTGVAGIGPVTALEILASFPFNKQQFLKETSKYDRYNHILAGLQDFKKWVRAGKRTDNVTLKKKLKNVDLTEDFPSMRVVQAYLEPNIENSEDKFTWGELDITVLRDYTKTKFGWSQNKLDEIIKPVIRRLADRKSQKSVQDYFKRKIEFQSLEDQMSKRVKAAVQKMDPNAPVDQEIITTEKLNSTKPGRKRKTKKDAAVGTDNVEPSNTKKSKLSEQTVLSNHSVKVVSQASDGKSNIEIRIPKSDRVQEFIPQREKDKLNLLQNKLKAIEVFRKTTIDKKKKKTKRRVVLPKEKAELSESSDSN